MSWEITFKLEFIRIILFQLLQTFADICYHLLSCIQPRHGPYPWYQRNGLRVARAFYGWDCRHVIFHHRGRGRQHVLDNGCVWSMRSGPCDAGRVPMQTWNMENRVSPLSPHPASRPPSYGAATTRQRRSTSPPLRQPSVTNDPIANTIVFDTLPFGDLFYSD